jgi:hypothetical protein
MDMPPMLAYTITGTLNAAPPSLPQISIGQGPSHKTLAPTATIQSNSYWFCVLDAKNPTVKAAEIIVPGTANHAVPAGLDQYMSNPGYIITLVTHNLSVNNVPQGDFYTYLSKHGASRELQKLEQLNTSLGCGQVTGVSYVLTVVGGNNYGYERGQEGQRVRYLMSLMEGPKGPPFSLCDSYTFLT